VSHSDDFDQPADEDEPEELQTYFGNVVEFVDHWLLPHYARNPKVFRWSPRWWEYTEVVGRLEALWRAWEYYRLEGMTGMAVFFNDYLDPTMRTITFPDGPFRNLGHLDNPGVPAPWASTPPPPDIFSA